MEKIRTGRFNPDALETPVEVHPIERAQQVTLKRLNYLIGFINEKQPEVTERYVSNLLSMYLSLSKKDLINSQGIDFPQIIKDMDNLEHYPDTAKAYMNYYLELLAPKPVEDWTNKAIKHWKEYITLYIIDNRPRNPVTGVEKLFERRTAEDRRDSEWVIVHSIIAPGKYAYKNENCAWVEAMEELPDTEFKYLVCCYGDFQHATTSFENIVLTMEHTIAEGDPYCSRVLHDTRVDWKLHHPPKEFWDEFN